jgi:hypothetical protein
MCTPEFFCLYLELGLVCLEFVDESFRCLPFKAGRTTRGTCGLFACLTM